MKRIVLGVQYDGMPWQGWQTQPHGQTVQDRLEAALQRFTRHRVATVCAGRTDTGVHALEQVVHFDTPLDRPSFSWVRGVNAFLPESIAVRWACEVQKTIVPAPGMQGPSQEFHARFSATARTYRYLLYNHAVRSPLMAGRAGWVFRPLHLDAMREAANALIGTHDFSAFRSSECQANSPVKTMRSIMLERHDNLVVVSLTANAFLHHMVRNIVGALVLAGHGGRDAAWMSELLSLRDRTKAPPTFMPDGLYLARIEYDPQWMLPQEPPSWPANLAVSG